VELAVIGLIGLITIVAAGAFSKKLGVAAPILLILIGIGYSFIPGAPTEVEPEIVLLGLLPPILYSAAIAVPIVDFRRNFSSIGALSFALVVVSALGTGFLLYMIFPDLSLPAAIAVGAVISPPDVVAATAIGKRLGLPPRLVTILEGEGLINDATAFVLLRSAIAATGTAVTFWGVAGDFLFSVVVAIVVGLIVGAVTVYVRSKLDDGVLDIAISFAVPFLAYIPAEHLGASGVLAVVVSGLYSGHVSAHRFSASTRINERLNWRTVQFVIENGVFLLMGVQISTIVGDVGGDSVRWTLLIGLLMTATLIVIRFAFVAPLLVYLRRRGKLVERRQLRWRTWLDRIRDLPFRDARSDRRAERAEQRYAQRSADIEQLRGEGLGWRGGLVLGWSGMRGVVTLAAAQSLPHDFPYRSQLVLVAFTVAVVTLVVQGGTLPWVIRLSGIRGTDRVADRHSLAELLDELTQAGVEALDNPRLTLADGKEIDPEALERARRDTLIHAESARERAENGVDERGVAESPHQQYRVLRREVLEAEREALLAARSEGSYPSRILERAAAMLDLEETRLEQIDNPSGA
jgi:CPA1 family monovalent cation:H+ antiporter